MPIRKRRGKYVGADTAQVEGRDFPGVVLDLVAHDQDMHAR
jgi:hypothetical protein